ncbi:hypothetical protein KIN20_020910 [Parelaphostrongylus tenuis]|uniref:Uncharacterized protein n=1 Tax=Parelaphostrongylus tenuis TaxID=148309 RepID=A0AAD5QR71_PARTN|nr:hypothetical protein KIN20_020910 [Parelaphostrongylus tenuis]
MRMDMVAPHCIIRNSTVTALCGSIDTTNAVNCVDMPMMVAAILANYSSFSGTSMNTNIMANWPRQMWQNVVNRAIQMLAAGPFVTHFSSAIATVS